MVIPPAGGYPVAEDGSLCGAVTNGADGGILTERKTGREIVCVGAMRLLIVTDAWYPQLNGVVRSIERMMELAAGCGAEIALLTPQHFRSVPLPSYPEIRLALARPGRLARLIARLAPTMFTSPPRGRSAS